MAEFKIKPGTRSEFFYFLADEVRVRPVDVDAEIFTRLDNARDYDWRRAAFEVVVRGVWQVPPSRSHPTKTTFPDSKKRPSEEPASASG